MSDAELQLRRQDRAARNLRYFEVVVLVLVVILSALSLWKVIEIASENKINIERHRHRNEEVHREIENLICDIIINRPPAMVSDGQRKACAGKGTNSVQ